jgi:hypothetical protein
LKVLSSSIEPETCTIIISATFLYSINFKTKSGGEHLLSLVDHYGS